MLPSNDSFGKIRLFSNETENCLRECNFIKYAAYRTAAKLRIIQKALFMDKVRLKVISSVFERHQLLQTENSVQLDHNEVESMLYDIYFVVQKENDLELDMDYISQLMISLLSNVYDKKFTIKIQVLSLKIILTVLCQAKPREKYQYLFEQMADHNNCLSRKKLEILLKKVISLTEYIGEGLSFGSELIPGTVESCFKINTGTLGISEEGFMNWLMQDPQLLVWLSTLYRIQISELVTHNGKCAMCKVYPIVGLRYKCLRCLSYDMCQMCFFTGKVSKKHKLKHPVQEYCLPMTSQQFTRAFLLTLRNRLYKKNSKLQYLPALRADSIGGEEDDEIMGRSTRLLDDTEVSSRTVVNGSRVSLNKFPQRELQSIIIHLERESEKLIPQIDYLCSRVGSAGGDEYQSELKKCLSTHKAQVENQVKRLKLLKNYLRSTGKGFGTKALLASTPMVEGVLPKEQKYFGQDLGGLSPITGKEDPSLDKKMMWDNYDLQNYAPETSWEELRSDGRENEISEFPPRPELMLTESEKSEICLSTWLGGKTLREIDTSSRRGFTWLQETDGELEETVVEGRKGKILEENEETFEELQTEMKKILSKLHELSIIIEPEKQEELHEKIEIKTAEEVDTLLIDLLNGIEKLLGS